MPKEGGVGGDWLKLLIPGHPSKATNHGIYAGSQESALLLGGFMLTKIENHDIWGCEVCTA